MSVELDDVKIGTEFIDEKLGQAKELYQKVTPEIIQKGISAYGRRFSESQQRSAEIDQQLADSGSLYHKLAIQPSATSKLLSKISNVTNIDSRITTPIITGAVTLLGPGGIRGLGRVARHPVTAQKIRNINPLTPASKKIVNVKATPVDPLKIVSETSATIRKKYPGMFNPRADITNPKSYAFASVDKPLKGEALKLDTMLRGLGDQSKVTVNSSLQSPQLAKIPQADLNAFAKEAIQYRAQALKLVPGDKKTSALASISGLGKYPKAYLGTEKVKIASGLQRELGTADRSALTHIPGMPFMNQHHEWMKKSQSVHINRAWELVAENKATVQDVVNMALLADDAGMGTGDYGTVGAPKITHDMTHQDYIKEGIQYDTQPWSSNILKANPKGIQTETWKAAKVAAKEINVKGVTKDDLEYMENWKDLDQGIQKWKEFRLSKSYEKSGVGDDLSEMDREGIRVNKINNINELTKDFIAERDRLPVPMKKTMETRTELEGKVIDNKDKLNYFKLRNLRKDLKADETLFKKRKQEVPEELKLRIAEVEKKVKTVKGKITKELLEAEEAQRIHLENVSELKIDKMLEDVLKINRQ